MHIHVEGKNGRVANFASAGVPDVGNISPKRDLLTQS